MKTLKHSPGHRALWFANTAPEIQGSSGKCPLSNNVLSFHTKTQSASFPFEQVGDPTDYLTAGDAPSLGSIWTRLKDDPNLGKARPAFILDSTHVGVDLLAESAAALALSSVLVRNAGDTQRADSFIQGAEALFTLAKSTPGREQSYCAFVPCGTTVSKAKMVPVVPLPASANLDPADIKCWVPDFPLATCGFLKDEGLCLNAAQTAPVYTRRSSCCAFMRSAGVWQNQTTPQVRIHCRARPRCFSKSC